MPSTNITMRMDEILKSQLQDLTFQQRMINEKYGKKAYQLAIENTKYNSEGKAVVEKDDEWLDETEWDDMFKQLKKEVSQE